ncbi:MAG TPA: penicillin-binding transpeptidase domain-containing protein [Mycobacteriales bacterium]|nr:penicillin-binding transpeptidase domain-containing protein [Mycobacteriales bacterium]
MTDRSHLRLVVLSVLVVSLVATLLGRLWYLQVLAAPQFRAEVDSSQVRDVVTQPSRGDVFDDMGRPLIDNKTALVISVDRSALDRQADGGKAVLHRLAKLLHTSYTKLAHETRLCGKNSAGHYVTAPCWGGSPYQPIPVSQLKPDLASTKRALYIAEMQGEYPGVTAQLAAVRNYPRPDGADASAILGYLEPIQAAQLKKLTPAQQNLQRDSVVGATGLEEYYNNYLRGRQGLKRVRVDHLGNVTGTLSVKPPQPGDSIVTNIDAKVQAALEQQLQDAITAARNAGKTADYDAGVVMNVRTGGIIAMSGWPTYQPNHAPPTLTVKQYKKLEHDPGHPLFDKAFEAAAAPGSSFKLISSSGLLWDGTANTYSQYDCSATYNHKHNFEGEVGGMETLHTAIVQSCDTVFYRLARKDWDRDFTLVKEGKKPVEGVQHIAHEYGLGENPDLDLPNAATGHIADRKNQKLAWEAQRKNYCAGAARRAKGTYLQKLDAFDCQDGWEFEPGDQEDEDIGQGTVTVSPLQLAVAYSALANGGKVFEPRVAKAIYSPTGQLIKRIKAPVRDHLSVSTADLNYIRQAMYGVTTENGGTAAGTFQGFPMNKVLVGGKTGTAELTGTNQDGAWFASFAGPAGGKPQYVTVIEVNKANEGAVSAAPYVRKMWEELYGLGGHKALFPNGVPPKKLPTIAPSIGGTVQTHHHSKSSKKSTPGSPPPSPSTTTAGGVPPVLPPELRPWAMQ